MAVTAMNTTELHDYLVETLPKILEENKDIQRAIFRISRRRFADADETNLRFDRMFEELQQERELSEKRWEENRQRWEKNQEELAAMRRESNERWKEGQQELAELRRESDERFERLMQEIKHVRIKHESSIGALGARWGIAAESSFRDGLKDLLEHDFGVQVINITEYDDDGEVFGRPDQIELDIIIKNSTLIICEIKSSMSRSDMYAFYRKVQFYEKRHQRKAAKLMVISPMVEPRAKAVAEKLGIIVHSYADDVEL